jgi:hypothetical protein
MIGTEQSAADDPDATNPEPSRPFTQQEVERAERAYEAAQNALDLPHLVGVRQRAEHLLSVPVIGTDGTIAPLSHWLDVRLSELNAHEGDTGAGGAGGEQS